MARWALSGACFSCLLAHVFLALHKNQAAWFNMFFSSVPLTLGTILCLKQAAQRVRIHRICLAGGKLIKKKAPQWQACEDINFANLVDFCFYLSK